MKKEIRTIDPYLLNAVITSFGVPEIPYDLKKIKSLKLDDRTKAGRNITFFECREHDFSVIGEMEKLHTLIMNTRNPLTVEDFSFLEKCKNLKKLDLVQTNFTDCALLAQLPALTYVRLPEQSGLVNTQVLDTLRARIEFAKTTTYDYPMEEIVNFMKEKSHKMAYALTLQKETAPDLFDSKFGGVPYWNLDMPYPVDRTGQKMMLLAQLNFDRASVDERLPQQGILQFFIALDDGDYEYGYDYEAPDRQEMFRVVYHETVDYTVTQEQILAMDVPVSSDPEIEDFTPVWKPYRVDISPREVYISMSDKRFHTVFRDAVKTLTGKNIGRQSVFDLLTWEDYCYLDDELSYNGHSMLGFPAFVQHDPRKSAKYYDTVLLQLHSELDEEEGYMCWADGGIANFFINSEALAKRDFSKVMYCWDCD